MKLINDTTVTLSDEEWALVARDDDHTARAQQIFRSIVRISWGGNFERDGTIIFDSPSTALMFMLEWS